MVGLLAMAAAMGTGGYFETGNTLYTKCTDPSWGLACTAFIEGVTDGMTLAVATGDKQLVCAPDTITAGQAKDVVTMYLRDHPATRNLNASLLVAIAEKEAWPCAK